MREDLKAYNGRVGILVLMAMILVLSASGQASGQKAAAVDKSVVKPYAYLPLAVVAEEPTCPQTSPNRYSGGFALQYDLDDPVRPAALHADKNIELRSYRLNDDGGFKRGLVDYGSDDPIQPPQLATLFHPARVPILSSFYQVHDWKWAPSPDPGTRGGPIYKPIVTALGLQTVAGEALRVPTSGYDIGGGKEVLVLYADWNTLALRYTREDSSGSAGYTVHLDQICVDPNLLALYRKYDDPNGPRYDFAPPSQRPYDYSLPNLPAGQPLGTALGSEIVVAVVDSGRFMDTRSCNEWWQIRPGFGGSCNRP